MLTAVEAPPVESVFLNKLEVCQLLRLSKASIDRMMATRRMPPPIKFGAVCRWRRDEVMDWIKKDCPSFNGGNQGK